jgi:hypothetical protein
LASALSSARVETVLIAGSIRIGSAPAGPKTSYPTGMGASPQLQANVINFIDGDLTLGTDANRSDMGASGSRGGISEIDNAK